MKAYELVKEAKESFNRAEKIRVDIQKRLDEYVNERNHLYMTLCRLELRIKNYKHKHEHKKEVIKE